MQEAVQRALESSYSLQEAEKRIATARSYVDRSSAWLATNPHVSAGGAASDSEFTRFRTSPDNPNQFVEDDERFGPSYTFGLEQTFEIAGQRGLRIEAAQRGLEVAIVDRRSREATARAEVKKAYTAALENDAKLALAVRSTELISQVNAGFDPQKSDTEAQRINYNTSTMQLLRQRRREATARRERNAAYAELKRLAAIPREHEITLLGELESHSRPLPALREMHDGLAGRRPDVLAYRGLLARADTELKLAKRSAIPDISLFAFISRFDGGEDGRETSGGGSVGVDVPIFQDNGPSIADAIVERQRAAAELDDLMRTVEANLGTAYRNCEEAAAELQLIKDEILPRAQENLELQRHRADRDEVTIYDVIDYQLDLVSTEAELVTARRVYTDALIDLEKAAAVTLVGPSPSSEMASPPPPDNQEANPEK